MTFKIDREILKIADYIEKLAFEMKAPNIYTPRFVSLVNEIRTAIHIRLAQQEQKPVTAQHRFRYPQNARFLFRHPEKTIPDWSEWQECKVSNRPAWEIDSRGYEVEYRNLYTAPPERQPLTYAEMKKIADEHLKSEYQPASYEMSGVFDLIRAVEYTKLKEMK